MRMLLHVLTKLIEPWQILTWNAISKTALPHFGQEAPHLSGAHLPEHIPSDYGLHATGLASSQKQEWER